LRGKGMPVLRSAQFGDLYIRITIETPQKLSKRQRELLARVPGALIQGEQPRIGWLLLAG
jgi:DnaJ-class molecular chaperone